MEKFNQGQEVTLNVRQETYADIFMPNKKYKVVGVKQMYLIEKEDGNAVWVDENEIE